MDFVELLRGYTIRDQGPWERCAVRFKLLHPNASVPRYAHDGDSGMDLAAVEALTLPVGGIAKVSLAIAIGLPPGYEAQIRPRSSLSAKGIVCAFGTIDQGYTGELAAVLYNLTSDVVTIEAGQRICQLVIAPVARVELQQVNVLGETERGAGGFGSTDGGLK